jgi:hypothetical protein
LEHTTLCGSEKLVTKSLYHRITLIHT